MIFDKVRVLGYNHENKFLGDNGFVISSTRTVSISGYVLDLTNSSGVNSILKDSFALQKECAKMQDIVINGKFFGRGRAVSFSVATGNWVRTTEYSATFEVYTNVDISQNILSREYDDIDLTQNYLKSNLRLIKNFSESFQIDFDSNSKNLNGSHSINIQYISDIGGTNQIQLAKALAGELLQSTSANIFEGYLYTYRTDFRKTASETYNLITNECNFNVSFSYKDDGTSDPYYVNRTHSISIDTTGIISVNESGEVIVETDTGSLGDILASALQSEVGYSGARCQSFFSTHAVKIGGSTSYDPLNINKELQKSLVIDRITGRGNYNIDYDNDPKRTNDKYILTRVLEMEFGNEGVWTITESGSSTGVGPAGLGSEKYENAYLGWTIVEPGISGRILSFYNTYAKNKTGSIPQYVKKNADFALYRGEITYTVQYSDDPKISDGSSDDGTYEIVVSDTGFINIVNDYVVPNETYAIQQNLGLIKQGTQTVTVRMLSAGSSDDECLHKHSTSSTAIPTFNGMSYFDKLRAKAVFQPSRAAAGYRDLYLESIDYSTDEVEKTADLTQTFKYS